MKVYNEEKMQEIRSKLGLKHMSYDEMCYFLFNVFINHENFEFYKDNFNVINEGSARTAYSIKNADAVIKISHDMEDYDKEVCLQGAIEHRMFEEYKEEDLCYEIYGFSNNYGVIFCQELETYLSNENIINYGLMDLYNYIKNIYEEDGNEIEMSEDSFNEYIVDNIVDYLNDNCEGYCIFDDIHIDNIGIDKEYGELRILDLGYGDTGSIAEEVMQELLEDKTHIIRGAANFNSTTIEQLIENYGGYGNEIVA